MCKIEDLNKSKKRITVITNDGKSYVSEWIGDDGETDETYINCTKSELSEYDNILKKHNISPDNVKTWFVSRKREKDTIYISDHAFMRMKERCGFNKKTAIRMVEKAYEKGTEISNVKDYLSTWAKKQELRLEEGERAILYGDFVYRFCYDTLVTVIHKPQKGKVQNIYGKKKQPAYV